MWLAVAEVVDKQRARSVDGLLLEHVGPQVLVSIAAWRHLRGRRRCMVGPRAVQLTGRSWCSDRLYVAWFREFVRPASSPNAGPCNQGQQRPFVASHSSLSSIHRLTASTSTAPIPVISG